MFAIRCYCKKSKCLAEISFKRKHTSMNRGLQWFVKKNLLFTNSITSGGCMAIGDFVQQEFEYHSGSLSQRYDWRRIGRMFLIGSFMGPLHHYYYIKLDQLIPAVNIKTVLFKIACDQAIASPLTLVTFFYGMGFLENKSLDVCTNELKRKFLYTYMGDWMYWPPIQFVNFYYLPTHLRVLYINVATMVFNVFLSYIKHYDQY